ncbi:MAG TPA: hypothetical protein VNG29_04005 [Candidatus Paceibacterota bacterium]|nr:hypothetical protein [Candidatus Paceibacterota bacterium]
MTKKQKIIAGLLFAAALFAVFFAPVPPAAFAADLTVAPAVIDGHGLPRDILNYTLTVTNNNSSPENVFASVYELTASGTQVFADPSTSNRPALLADWIEVSRGATMFQPGESKTIPVMITINPSATAGDYHAVIAFVTGSTRNEAETHLNGAPQALVNLSVASDAKEALQIDSFGPAKRFYSGFPVEFDYIIENIGTVSEAPKGSVLLYDRTGHEIGSIDANPGGISIAPGEKKSFTAQWQNGQGLGQYKASLDILYGATNETLESVALFWILPWEKLLIIFGILFAVVIVLAVVMHKEYEKRHHRRMRMMQHLLKDRSVVDLRHPRHRDE